MKISKFLKNTLKKMKKKEAALVECNDKSLLQYGKDYEIIIENLKEVPSKMIYLI